MIEVARRVAPILATGLVVIASGLTGFWMGDKKDHEKSTQPVVTVQVGRFLPIGDGKALDTKTGKTCLLEVHLSPGASLVGPFPACSELVSQ